jgi:hypothetical protein
MNTLLRLFLIYLVLMGLIYMIPFPYRMTKEGFTATNDLDLSPSDSLSDTIKANDQTLYCATTPCSREDTGSSESSESSTLKKADGSRCLGPHGSDTSCQSGFCSLFGYDVIYQMLVYKCARSSPAAVTP